MQVSLLLTEDAGQVWQIGLKGHTEESSDPPVLRPHKLQFSLKWQAAPP
jgi:hypothetical protein